MLKVISPSSQDAGLEDLLRDIDCGRIQLPEFQRGLTWDDARIRAILASAAWTSAASPTLAQARAARSDVWRAAGLAAT